MKLINRYVYAVTEYLPEEIREDVGRELRTNIEDMLPENPTDKDIYEALEKLGNPWNLANEYNPKKRYLIGPRYYDNYLFLLKIVVGICVAVFGSIAILSWAVDPTIEGSVPGNLASFISVTVSSMLEGALQGSFWVTLVCVILEKSGVESGQLPFSKKKWSPNDLPDLPMQNKGKISRVGTVFSMLATVFLAAMLYFQPQLIAVYRKATNGGFDITPVFDFETLKLYMPIIILLSIINLGILIWMFVASRWSKPLAVFNTIHNVGVCALLFAMFNDNSIFSSEFFTFLAELTKMPMQDFLKSADRFIWVFIAIVIIMSIWDSVEGFINSKRKIKYQGKIQDWP